MSRGPSYLWMVGWRRYRLGSGGIWCSLCDLIGYRSHGPFGRNRAQGQRRAFYGQVDKSCCVKGSFLSTSAPGLYLFTGGENYCAATFRASSRLV